ncbi:MAG: NusA-like transcription termination signal-binding factor [Candidatus Woesearchaeota archaeon]
MGKIVYDQELMKTISFFEAMTGARVKDCFKEKDDTLTFVVEEGEIGKAIGRGGSNIRRLETALNRKIKIVEFNPELTTFARNLIMPLRAEKIELKDKVLFIKGGDAKIRGMLIGRDSKNLKSHEEIIKKYFDIEKIRVI